ncbi:MAG: FAD-dependent oxidoreductase [Planctomycetes bacterium]|nr:FAD-dependent oxidoreductase [Planctomycetota bacterium]
MIIGAGVGGTRVANMLSRDPHVEVTLINNYPDHLFQPGFLHVPFGAPSDRLSRDEQSLLRSNVTFRVDRAKRIDPDARHIHLESGATVDYDWLVIATGARVDQGRIPGLSETNHHFHCHKAARRLAEELPTFRGGRIVVGACSLPYKCPPSAPEFAFLLDAWLRRRGLRESTTLSYVYPTEHVFPLEPVARSIRPLLEERGIEIHTSFAPTTVDPQRRILRAGDHELPFDLLALVPPHTGSPAVRDCDLTDEHGWVRTDPATLRVADRIYALGDATNLPRPKSGAAAHFQSDVVVRNILSEVRGNPPGATYDGHVTCFMETGDGRAGVIDFTYARPPQPARPSRIGYWRKALFSRLYFPLLRRA